MKNSRKGFTLVELLIVIVVIGILSAMMMLSSTEAVTSAKASNIVSNLRNLKTAALAYYVDHLDAAEGKTTADEISKTFKDDVLKYLKASDSQTVDSNYDIVVNASGWFVTYTISGTDTEKTAIQNKLEGRAKSVGLCDGKTPNKDTYYSEANDKTVVGMFVR